MRRADVIVLAAAVAAAASTARLGWWQLDRAAQKVAAQDERDRALALPVLGTVDLVDLVDSPPGPRRVVIEGRWIADATVYLENRQMDGRAGFHVVTPLATRGGPVVAVQRGWLPRDPSDRTRIAPYHTSEAEVRISGRITPAPSRIFQLGEAASGPIRQNLDLASYATQIGRRLPAWVVVQHDDDASAPPDGLLRNWPQPASDLHKHYGYAFQWFALSALVIALYVWFRILRPRRRRQD